MLYTSYIETFGEVSMEFRDLKMQYLTCKESIDSAIQKVLQDASFISGGQVGEVEDKLAKYVGVKHCISCANGTDALQLALMTWGIGKGDAVFVPDFTFFSSGEVVQLVGATPVFVDVDRATYNISSTALEEAIQKVLNQTNLAPKVIVAVDLFGQPADYEKICTLAQKYNMYVLEDGAQGFGGKIGEKRACSFGDISTTSFFPAKPLGCYGDGGAIFTNHDEWAKIIRSLCVHGKGRDKYDNVRIGMNSRLDTLQAAVLQVKLRHFIESELEQVNKVAEWYKDELNNSVISPDVKAGYYSSWAQYTIVCRDSEERERIRETLHREQIPSMIYYKKGMHKQKAFEGKYVMTGDYKNTNFLTERVLSLPMHPYLKRKEVEYVGHLIKGAVIR